MKIEATCKGEFKAFHSSGVRKLSEIRWIVLHDEEAPTARGAAEYFTNPNSGGSAHLTVDDIECYRCLTNAQIPWGAASAFGANTEGFHIEQAGYAAWSVVIWERHRQTLRRAAYKTALHCKKFSIPVEFVFAKDLPAKAGITTHAEVSKASRRIDPANSSRYSHSDPGLFWPRKKFMGYVREYYAGL